MEYGLRYNPRKDEPNVLEPNYEVSRLGFQGRDEINSAEGAYG
jgi:hypothetical protein